MPTNKYAVIGIGQFGSAIARALSNKGYEVMAIDSSSDIIDSISDDVAYAVALNATDKRALQAQNIEDFDAVVVAIGSDFEQRLLCASVLLDLNIKRIITRANGDAQRIILEKMGIKEILSPEEEVGIIVAERMLNPSILNYMQLPDNHRIVELITPANCINKTFGEIDLRDRYKLSLITVRKELRYTKEGKDIVEHHITGVPDSKQILESTDRLVVFGHIRDIDRFLEINV
jgi:trk system potassium uptake protein TrkA